MPDSFICDFHSHILPSIDDGSKSVNESIGLIKMEMTQGVKHICLTPHYYPNRNLDNFLNLREQSYQSLLKSRKHFENVSFSLGAECALSEDLKLIKNIDKLCIENTNLLLLELPNSFWGEWIPYTIYSSLIVNDITPIIAHADRYLGNKLCSSILDELINMKVSFQLSASSLKRLKTIKFIKKLLKNDIVPVIGSDAHNLNLRPVKMNTINKFPAKFTLGKDFINLVNDETNNLLNLI